MRKAYSYVRMSTKQQIYGDSLRRQLDASKAYASRNNLELVETIDGQEFKDIGVSAYKGNNVNSGAFSMFLALIEENRIEKNSVLLVESLDRISRESLSKALPQFLDIINHGIEIVTLIDEQSYTQAKIDQNVSALYGSLAIMQRANEESEVKSKRLQSAWENKRKNAKSKVVTKLAPFWIHFSTNSNRFELIPERANTIKLIYELCINAFGLYAITKHLNEKRIEVFGKSQFWNRSYVKKILTNRASFGQYQPCKMIDGKRSPYGDPIANYYPSVIDEDTYYLAQSAIERRTVNQKGRKGTNYTNIFSGLLYCKNCGTKMSVRNRGEPPKGGKTLICQSKLMGAYCDSIEWKLVDVEHSIIEHLKEINFEEITKGESSTKILEGKLASLDAEKKSQELIFKNIESLLSEELLNTQAASMIAIKFNEAGNRLSELTIHTQKIKQEISTIRQESVNSINSSKELLQLVNQNQNDYLFRSKLNQMINKSLHSIELTHINNAFIPDELSSDDMEVIDFLKLNPGKKVLSFNELLSDKDFERFVTRYHDRIKITYKSGLTRQILYGMAFSLLTNGHIKS